VDGELAKVGNNPLAAEFFGDYGSGTGAAKKVGN
jgi:hypothetical protein